MNIYVKNTSEGLIALYNSDLEEKKRLKIGEVYEVSIRRPRNYLFHKKFFAMCKIGWQNTEIEMPFDSYRRYLIMKAGFFKTYKTPRGTYFEAESISFANMDNDKMQEVYCRVLDVILKDTGITEEVVERELINFM